MPCWLKEYAFGLGKGGYPPVDESLKTSVFATFHMLSTLTSSKESVSLAEQKKEIIGVTDKHVSDRTAIMEESTCVRLCQEYQEPRNRVRVKIVRSLPDVACRQRGTSDANTRRNNVLPYMELQIDTP